MTTYQKLKESLDKFGYVSMLEHCTLHHSHSGDLGIYSFNQTMLVFSPHGYVSLHLSFQDKNFDGHLRRLNAYLPEPYRLVRHDYYLVLENGLNNKTYVYKPGMTINPNGEISRGLTFEQMAMLLEGIHKTARYLLRTVINEPPKAPIESGIGSRLPWEIENDLLTQTLSSETMLTFLQEAQKEYTYSNYWAALVDLLAPETYTRPTDRPPSPSKISKAQLPTGNYNTCSYRGDGTCIFCTVRPYGFDGTKSTKACDICTDWKGDPIKLEHLEKAQQQFAERQLKAQQQAAVDRKRWLSLQQNRFHSFQARKQQYCEAIATLKTDPMMQSILAAQLEKVLKRGLSPIHVIF